MEKLIQLGTILMAPVTAILTLTGKQVDVVVSGNLGHTNSVDPAIPHVVHSRHFDFFLANFEYLKLAIHDSNDSLQKLETMR